MCLAFNKLAVAVRPRELVAKDLERADVAQRLEFPDARLGYV